METTVAEGSEEAPPPPLSPISSRIRSSDQGSRESSPRSLSSDDGDSAGVRPIVRAGRRYLTLPASAYSSLLPYQVPQVEGILTEIFKGDHPQLIVDATAHIGGDAIHFADFYPMAKVIAIDVDPSALECLRYNIEHNSDPSRFEVYCADSSTWIREQHRVADLYYFDPPWGGPNYSGLSEVHLYLGDQPIVETINYILRNSLAKKVILKVPRNFAYPEFKSRVVGNSRLFMVRKTHQQRGMVAYGLVLIEPRP